MREQGGIRAVRVLGGEEQHGRCLRDYQQVVGRCKRPVLLNVVGMIAACAQELEHILDEEDGATHVVIQSPEVADAPAAPQHLLNGLLILLAQVGKVLKGILFSLEREQNGFGLLAGEGGQPLKQLDDSFQKMWSAPDDAVCARKR